MTALGYNCSKPECSIAATGKCLELHEPSSCPHAKPMTIAVPAGKPVTQDKVAARVFRPATELGLKDAQTIMCGSYTHVVAILGATDAGKTCMLNALYLLASHAGLSPRFKFAGSLTLQGFELRTRRLRKWESGKLPEQLADHTTHADPRNPGLLHLALCDSTKGMRRFELLLTDLPGEWTTGLIERAQYADRFKFLQRADGLVIAIDGRKLWDVDKKQAELLNLEHLVDRLREAVKLDLSIPIFFVACKADASGVEIPPGLERAVAHAKAKGYDARAVAVASFSHNPDEVKNGYGIQSLVESIIDYQRPRNLLPKICPQPTRSFGRSLGTT